MSRQTISARAEKERPIARTAAFACRECGAEHTRWEGRCRACGAWNTLGETPRERVSTAGGAPGVEPVPLPEVPLEAHSATATGSAELDRVLGGGVVAGSSVLVGGEPGIGKSTLMLQVAGRFAAGGHTALYCSAEESAAQVGRRGKRLGLESPDLLLLATNSLADLRAALVTRAFDLVVVDSVQALADPALSAPAGSASAVRHLTQELVALARRGNFALLLVGHVTKLGGLAGPKVLEHLVDCVTEFHTVAESPYRFLRGRKNRFGPADEVGVFEMGAKGLSCVADPEGIFLEEVAGGGIFVPSIAGSRVFPIELQALAVPCAGPTPRVTASGFDARRLQTLLAVLERHTPLEPMRSDVYLAVARGLQIRDPAADLAALLAAAAALLERPLPPRWIAFGEVGLGGELRRVPHAELRLREAARLGFEVALVPPGCPGPKAWRGRERREVHSLGAALEML